MTIFLKDIWQIDNPSEFKVHFGRWNTVENPLDVWVRDKKEWVGWQEYRPQKNEFNRPYIFSLIQFYRETDTWLFGGVFNVLERYADRYEVEQSDLGQNFIGRLKLYSPYRGRGTRAKFEKHIETFEMREILNEPYYGRAFPGYENIDLTFEELETHVKNGRLEWKTPLMSISGIYLITDVSTGRRYIGSAYGDQGIWGRWNNYINSGHGGNAELRTLVTDPSLDYCRKNFRFALLEHHAARTPDEVIIARETFWKEVLLSRGQQGLNRN